jgi:CxxC-x17-CxxC domain-containing protein
MSVADKTLTCRDCKESFTFTVAEQELFASQGRFNEPSRCADCRAARKQSRGGDSSNYRNDRRMETYTVTCAACGGKAQVPFEPRGDRAVYCSVCYETRRRESGRSDSSHTRR